jgi:acyl-homoserine lactone acylase PvdQ
VDITLRVAMGALCYPVPINGTPTNLGVCTPANAPVGNVPFTDGAPIKATDLQNSFPYLNTPLSGSPLSEHR